MAKVKTFAWYAGCKEKQESILKALQESRPQFKPMREYISLLANSLGQVKDSCSCLTDSSTGILQRLQKLSSECSKNQFATENKKMKAQVTCKVLLYATVAIVGSAGFTALTTAIPSLENQTIVFAIGTAGLLIVSDELTTSAIADKYKNILKTTDELMKQVAEISEIANSIRSVIAEVHRKFQGLNDIFDNTKSISKRSDLLCCHLELLFQKCNAIEATYTESHHSLAQMRKYLNTSMFCK